AWQQFATIYAPIIYRMAIKRGLQDADAQDLVQQILLSVSQSIQRWEKKDEKTKFRHWLRRVAKNAILNALTRKPKDLPVGGTAIDHAIREYSDSEEKLLREIELEHRREVFFNATSILQKEFEGSTWEVFKLSVIENLSIQDVADRVGKTVGATYAARGRMMSRLRKIVSELEEDEHE
ncbi:MAG: sigma-70 family RNA polymerase sigma factor, partial [Planctomycetota bacterium]